MSGSDFDRLGALEFERLCHALLLRMHGVAVETWSGPGDRGADAFCRRSLTFPDLTRPSRGPFVFQVKFVEAAAQLGRRAQTRLRDNLLKERAAIERRIAKGVWVAPRHYVLMTNVRVPPSAKARVLSALAPALSDAEVHLLDRQRLDTMLTAAGPDLRRSFPTMLSFRDLTAVVQGVVAKPLLNRSQAFLNAARALAPVFITTRAYGRALAMLETHGFVVLTGAPEMGKTSIANMLAASQAAIGWDVIDCQGPEDFDQAFDQHRRQLFVADDVFGSTEYVPAVAQAWERSLPKVIPQLDVDHWFIWTSRPAPLREGLEGLHLQGPAERFPNPANVTVDTSDLTLEERASMLYVHCKNAGLNASAREFIVRHGEAIAAHPRFTPLRAGRFAREAPKLLAPPIDDPEAIIDTAMSDVTGAMRTAFNTMSDEQHTLLVSALDVDAEMSVDALEAAYDRHRSPNAPDGRTVRQLLELLEEQVLRRIDPGGRYAWTHPSWRDLVITQLMNDSRRRSRFLSNCDIAGFELAASTAGGAGDRQQPFLRTPADWTLYASRATKLAATSQIDHHRRLLLVISVLLDAPQEHDAELTSLAGGLLDQVREIWDAAGLLLPSDLLELYYDVSSSVRPLRPGPRLDPTFDAHSVCMTSRFSRVAIEAYDDALAFIETVGHNEPRALRTWRYPDRWEAGLRRLIAETEERGKAGNRLVGSGKRTEAWQERARELSAELLRWRQMLTRMRRHAPELSEPARRAADRLRRTEHELDSWLVELRSGRSDHEVYDEYLMRGAWRDDGDPDERNSEKIAAIFSPLALLETA